MGGDFDGKYIGVLIALLLALIFFIPGIYYTVKKAKFNKNGVRLDAVIKDKKKVYAGRYYSYKFLVSYCVDGNSFEKWVKGTADNFKTCLPGDKMEVICIPKKQQVCANLSVQKRLYRIFFAVGALFVAMAVGIIFFL